jgi:hypothetical protein
VTWTSPSSISRRWSAWRSASSRRSSGWASTSSRRARSFARSRSWLLLSLVAALPLAGCYASTEPATKVGGESATLNARGTANNGPANSWFEYWQTGTSNTRLSDPLHFPAGASGGFSAGVNGLAANTSYSFRVCGTDTAAYDRNCAQTRTFKTGAAVNDLASGDWNVSPHFNGTVDAHSGPAGQDPHGTVYSVDAPFSWHSFAGSVTCLRVSGNKAAVGAVGKETLADGHTQQPATLLVTIVDGGPTGTDTLAFVAASNSTTTPNCATASFDRQAEHGSAADLVVNDAP